MMQDGLLSLAIAADGYRVLRDGTDEMWVRSGEPEDWGAVRAMTAGQRDIAVRIAESDTLVLTLAAMPRSRHELRALVSAAAPILPGELAWTEARALVEGGAETQVVRRAWLAPKVNELERELPHRLRLLVEPTGAALWYRSPAARSRNLMTGAVVGAALAISIAAIAMARHSSRDAVTYLALPGVAVAPQSAGLSAILTRLVPLLPPGAQLMGIARDRRGMLSVGVATVDPDGLRATAGDTFIQHWRETGRGQIPGSGYRVDFTLIGMGDLVPARAARALFAATRAEAEQTARSAILAVPRDRAVVAELNPGISPEAGPLVFAMRIAGPQGGVLALADRIESGLPPARFVEWRLEPQASGIRLTGTLELPWRTAS
ncbi:MAG: hypothetical protein ABIT09_05530 [Croceibacterium sp.]